MRRAPDQRWSAEMIEGIKGTPAEPNPGSGSDVIPTYARKREEKTTEQYKPASMEVPQVRPVYIYKSDVETHGPTPGCKACQAIGLNRPGHSTGGYPHTPECRQRFEEILHSTGSERMRRADERMRSARAHAAEEEEMEDDGPAAHAQDVNSRDGPHLNNILLNPNAPNPQQAAVMDSHHNLLDKLNRIRILQYPYPHQV